MSRRVVPILVRPDQRAHRKHPSWLLIDGALITEVNGELGYSTVLTMLRHRGAPRLSDGGVNLQTALLVHERPTEIEAMCSFAAECLP